MKLKGKTAVITGGNSGIGLAIARRFVAEGAHVFITGRRKEQLEVAVKLIGEGVEAVPGDVTDSSDLERLFTLVREKTGTLDILVVNSGVGDVSPLEHITFEHFDKVFDVNVRAAVFTVKGALALLNEGSSVILVGSIAGSKGAKGTSIYSASKAALRSLGRTWANELAEKQIRVNVLSPGPIDTPMMAGVPEEFRAQVVGMVPLKRLGDAEEVASAALFLASDESSFITGAELCIDGGMAQT